MEDGNLITKELSVDKQSIQAAVDHLDSELRELALKIHANPELAFNELNTPLNLRRILNLKRGCLV
jgi:metal-dependent amidase/aminoacylase/carboxypeptidase family protein